MATDPFPQQLPTLDKLRVTDLSNVSASEVATEWLDAFSAAITQSDVGAVVDLFLDDGFWKDVIALTWDLRTFEGRNDIAKLLDARLAVTNLREIRLLQEPLREPELRKLFPDFAWVRFCFGFTTMHGKGTGVVYLVPLPDSTWKAYSLLTCLDMLTDFPEKVGSLTNSKADDGTWEENRRQEIEFSSNDPTVLVIGAGHSGLETAARLKYIGVPTLIIDKKPRVGDNWRDRYKALCLHDIIWYDQTPYLSFPSTWPVYSPARKLADWLEGYAKFLELNVWTASTIKKSSWNDTTKTWTVEVNREGKETRTLTVKHLVFATGMVSRPKIPDIPGKASFEGSTVHSSQFTSAANYIGKKAVVVGACSSGHDIAQDFFDHGIDVTIAVYREGFPIELADTCSTSLPHAVLRRLSQRIVPAMARVIDKDILDGLAKVGFKTNLGPHGTGLASLFYERGGGSYIDTGTCQHIINGDIKIKNDSAIEGFTEDGLRFSDGTELHADIIVFATGFGDHLDAMREACGDEVASKVGPVWGMDNEGQLQGVWRHCGHDGLWFAMGHMALSRFHSLHLAMQIKAIEEGILNKADVVI
ncbi:FAD/NAD(P)-binding domain-containing protein [Rhizopogon vinicolor AM-OR11-026]|uniref:FAD/NAD(P)-binding domain-containing protein n=1 Tax=Rhizopogon vinicolor AM-OR11-026 TaxID=1314800 RepID=A0A1B7MIZ2_9AGAM|nr:FAD/NAD(P)-binding domain-containing protein [Rhizopogon vinicolor AM-OR11-026]